MLLRICSMALKAIINLILLRKQLDIMDKEDVAKVVVTVDFVLIKFL